jgi:colicin import membrane protein
MAPTEADAMTPSTAGRDPFMPKAPKVRGRALALAVLAHVLLIVALALGVNWRSDEPTPVAAELWAATPQAAAPRAAEPPPTAPPPVTAAKSTPKPPEPVIAPKPTAPPAPDPQIAIEKAKREESKRLAAEEDQQQKKLLKREREKEREKEQAERAKDEAAQKQSQQAKAATAKLEQAKSDKAESARLAATREAQMQRIAGLAGATGAAGDTGTAMKSSGPSAGYGGRVAAKVRPNILFTDTLDGNPGAVVQVRLAADGTIVSKRLLQSSGVKAWDDAVLRAIDRTETLPLDNGRAPPMLELEFRPRF